MADLDYWGIAERIQEILQNDEETADVIQTIAIMDDGPRATELMPWVGIYYAGFEDVGGPICAGKTQRFGVTYDIWTYSFSMEAIREAARATQAVMQRIKVALMRHPTLDGMVESLRVTGGTFEVARTEAAFVMGGSIRLRIQALART